ncbi:MAG: response regulator transcription factor [Eggerthellaceae bacterium]|nr:response regulator transcription factor [Eggerthellaceae bacterium]
MPILIVEDDVSLARALQKILQDNGYEVDVVHSGTDGLSWAESGYYDVVVLDVMLPGMDGFEVARQLRRAGVSTPVLLLTARDAVPDKITGLDSGADDYMTKPFSPAELMAHLRALTRRQGEVVFERLSLGDLALDLDSRELRCGAKAIGLSEKEFAIARILMENPRQIISKEQLMSRAWGIESDVGENNIEAFISFLRKKMKHVGSTVKLENVRKVGYRLVMPDE